MQNEIFKQYPLISIVTVNYGHSDVTCEMIDSLEKITYPNIEVIVVDNASPNDKPEIIKDKYPYIKLIKNVKNFGFAGANNIGILDSKGKYILLLNNDTIVDPNFLEPLVDKMESDTSIGAVSPKIRFFCQQDTIQYAGLTPINNYSVRSHGIGFKEIDKGQYDEDQQTAYAHGAAMMIRKETIRKVGLMSNAFFLYYEELDWGFRVRQAGYKIYYVHNSLIYHKESVTTGKMSPLKTYYLNRSRLLYMRRNIRGVNLLISVLFQVFLSIPKNTFMYLFSGRFNLLIAYWKALGWHIKNLFLHKEIHGNPNY